MPISAETQAVLDGLAASGTSKAGVRDFTINGTRYQEQIDKDGKPLLDKDGNPQIVQIGPDGKPKPVSVGRGGTLYDASGNPLAMGAPAPVSPGSSLPVYDENGKQTGWQTAPKAQDSPAQTANAAAATSNAASEATNANTTATTAPVNAAANITNAQTGLINAKIAELANNEKLTEEQRKAQFDTWWKINIELPQAQETAAIARVKYAAEQGNNAREMGIADERQRAQQENPAWGRYLGGGPDPGWRPQYADASSFYQAGVLKALKDIDPASNAAWNAQFNNGQGLGVPSVPAPAVLPGGGPDPMQAATPISDAATNPAVLAQQIAAQAAARKAAMVPYVPVDNNASRSYAAA